MSHFLIVVLGGGLGAGLRYGVGLHAMRLFGTGFPFGTLIVNIIGSFLMGLLVAFFAGKGANFSTEPMRLFFMTGLLGGFTTFSAFSLDAFILYERGDLGLAAIYIAASVIISIVALFCGIALMRAL